LYGIGVLQDYLHNRTLSNRWKKPLLVGILNDIPWDLANDQTYSWTDVNPKDWETQLKFYAKERGLSVVLQSVRASSQLDSYTVILNPYGGVYPEENLVDLTSFQNLVEFVRKGGLLVNVADIPTYWAHISVLKKRLEAAETVYATSQQGTKIQILPTKPFELTPLAKKLGLHMIPFDDKPVKISLDKIVGRAVEPIFATRLVIVESNVESRVPPQPFPYSYPDGKSHDMTPIFSVKYAKGEFLISLPCINDSHHNQVQKDVLRDAICIWTLERLEEQVRSMTSV
jgi:hypothetical protein